MAAAAPESHLRENPFRIAQQQLQKVADTFGIDERLVDVLQECKKAVEVSIPTSLDDGSVRAFTGLPRHAQRLPRARRRAASATTRTSRSTRSRRSPCG